MSTTKTTKTTAKAIADTATDSLRIMARRNASLSSLVAGMESNAKNHEACILEAKRKQAYKQGKASITDMEGETIRFLDPSVFRSLSKQYDKGDRFKESMIRCADYLTGLEYLAKAGVIAK